MAIFSGLKSKIPLIISIISGAMLVFLGGVLVGHLKLPPQPMVLDALKAVADLAEHGKSYYANKPTRHLNRLRFENTGIVAADIKLAQPGVTFLVGLFGNALTARLYALDGTLIHEWPIDFFKLDPEVMKYKFDALIHGAWLYSNGDFVANYDGRGMVRVSACGKILWRNKERTHHSIFIDDEGYIWSPKLNNRGRYIEKSIMEKPFLFDQIGRFDPESGELVKVIDLVQVMVEASAQGLVKINNVNPDDIFHLNDVEILSKSMADSFPLLEAGDIMLSSRHLNQIWILDGNSHDLKWWQTGPMIGQHDPDFQADGTITLFDNRHAGSPREDNGFLGDGGGSRILSINHQSRAYKTLYASNEYSTFYSPFRGKHQILENGNILLAETDAGRAFEILPNGKVVWSYINAWDEDEVGWILGAHRYPASFASIANIECSSKKQHTMMPELN